jgi:HEAT repeat protein
MLSTNSTQQVERSENLQGGNALPLAVFSQLDLLLIFLLGDLSPEKPWPVRKEAAQKLADHPGPESVQGLLNALPNDPFWMVRCAIIQSLVRIGDPKALDTLNHLVQKDRFQIVRSYAINAIEQLSAKLSKS